MSRYRLLQTFVLTRLAAILSAAVLFQSDGRCCQISEDSAKTATYLRRLGLPRLELEWVIREMDRQPDRALRVELSGRFAAILAEFVYDMGVPTESDLKILKRATQLETDYPELDSSAFKLAVLQAHHILAETQFRKTWTAGEINFDRSDLGTKYAGLASRSRILRERLEQELHDRLLDARQINAASLLSKRKLQDVEVLLARHAFLHGWLCYFAGILQHQERSALLAESETAFREILQIDTGTELAKLPPDWLELSSRWQTQSLLGLGICLQARHLDKDADWCFQALHRTNVAPDISNRLHSWQFYGWCFGERPTEAINFAIQQSTMKSVDQTDAAQRLLWLTCLDSVAQLRNTDLLAGTMAERLGFSGLACQLDFSTFEQHFERLKPIWNGENFQDVWLTAIAENGQRSQSRNSPEAEDKFALGLERAIGLAGDETSPLDRGVCLLILADTDLNRRSWESSFRHASNAVDYLLAADSSLAADAAWVKVQAAMQLAGRDSHRLIEANIAIDDLSTKFPGSRFRAAAEFNRLKLEISQLGDDQAAIRWGEAQVDADFGGEAKLQQVLALHRRWLQSRGSENEPKALSELRTVLEPALVSPMSSSISQQLKLQLLDVDVLIRTATPGAKLESAPTQREALRNLREKLANGSALVSESLYYEALLAEHEGDVDLAKSLARDLVGETRDPGLQQFAWSILSRDFEQKFVDKAPFTPEELQQATELYRNWLASLSRTLEPANSLEGTQKQVIRRLARLHVLGGGLLAANELYDRLIELEVNDAETLLAAATTKTELEKKNEAIVIWRKLAAGSSAGSEIWLRAKYGLAVCLLDTDERTARQVAEQAIQLDPQMNDEWKQKFIEFVKR